MFPGLPLGIGITAECAIIGQTFISNLQIDNFGYIEKLGAVFERYGFQEIFVADSFEFQSISVLYICLIFLYMFSQDIIFNYHYFKI